MSTTIYPPGTTAFMQEGRDALGNLTYTGALTIVPPPTLANPTPEAIPIKPTYAEYPAPAVSSPIPVGSPGTRTINAVVREGVRVQGGDLQNYSTGPVSPTRAEGWTNSAAAIGVDGLVASASAVGGTDLSLSGFNFNLPDGAVITGLRVTVKRSKT